MSITLSVDSANGGGIAIKASYKTDIYLSVRYFYYFYQRGEYLEVQE